MRDSYKKYILISSIIISYILLLYITSNLAIIEIIITIVFWRIVYISNKSYKKAIKYWWSSIGLLGTILILIVGYFPIYQNKPNTSLYTQIQSRKIFVESKDEISIIKTIQWDFIQKQEISKTSKEIFLKEYPLSTITFSSNKWNLIIQYPDQTTIYIYPNTTFSLQVSGRQQIIENINGIIEYTTWSSNKIYIKNWIIKNTSDFLAKWLIQDYKNKQKDFLLEQAGWVLMENQTIRTISHNILWVASQIRPGKYLPYLDNEKQYYKLLGRIDNNRQTSFEDQKTEITNDMVDNASFGQEKTRFLKYIKTNE